VRQALRTPGDEWQRIGKEPLCTKDSLALALSLSLSLSLSLMARDLCGMNTDAMCLRRPLRFVVGNDECK
jgi:hypothetical protein